jgi:branched-chain amino acid transport system ATP-binding protein
VVSAGLLVTAILVQAHMETVRKVMVQVGRPFAVVTRPVARALATPFGAVNTFIGKLGKVANPFDSVTTRLGEKKASLKRTRSKTDERVTLDTEAGSAEVTVNGESAQIANNGIPVRGTIKKIPSKTNAWSPVALVRQGKGWVLRAVSGVRPGKNSQAPDIEVGIGAASDAGEANVVPAHVFPRAEAPVVLEGRDVTVRFGGLTAVSEATIEIRQGEIVGLIGPNGAGKTTLFNSLSGLNQPTSGRIKLFGEDVSAAQVHERAKMGLGRTFQVLQLFSDLTVRENLLVATHVHNETGFMRHILATDEAVRAERAANERVREVLQILELEDLADRPAAGLPFGILRLVELGRAVVTEAPVILLDEAASGLDNTETDRFTDFLRSLRERMGISMLLIEHDVRMVTGVSDYMYVLNMGKMIAEGPPDHIQKDQAVISAYLGTPDAAAEEPVPAGAV